MVANPLVKTMNAVQKHESMVFKHCCCFLFFLISQIMIHVNNWI